MMQNSMPAGFDGSHHSSRFDSSISDYTTTVNYVYVLDFNNQVHRSRDLKHWTMIDSLGGGARARSIEVYDDIIYLGTTDSGVYKSDAPRRTKTNIQALIPAIMDLLDD